MNTMIILTLISVILLAMAFLGIRLPFVSVNPESNKFKIYRKIGQRDDSDLTELEEDPEIAYNVIKKQLKPRGNLKQLKTLIPKNDDHLFRIKTLKRKVAGI